MLVKYTESMSSGNCSIVNCESSQRSRGVGIFRNHSEKTDRESTKEWLDELPKTRESTTYFKEVIP